MLGIITKLSTPRVKTRLPFKKKDIIIMPRAMGKDI